MSTIKISQLPELLTLDANTSNTILVGIDLVSGLTSKLTANTLSKGLYAFNPLYVGITTDHYPGTIAQFTATEANSYVQVNIENTDNFGTADYVVTANTGTDTTNYLDLGLSNSLYNPNYPNNSLGTLIGPLDGYLYVQGGVSDSKGNLSIGTINSGTETKFFSGGGVDSVAKISNTGLFLYNGKILTFGDGTTQITAANPPIVALSAFDKANSAYTLANNGSSYANNGIVLAQAAFNTQNGTAIVANTKYSANGGTIAGSVTITNDLTVTGNVFITGNSVNLLSPVVKFNDSLLYLANNNLNDNVDIGFIADYYNGSANVHAGFVRDPNLKEFIAFNNYAIEINTNNQINIADPSFAYANINAQTFKGNLISNTINTNSLYIAGNTLISNGFITIVNNINMPNVAPIRILNSANTTELAASLNGYMIHISGKENNANRIILDCFGNAANSANIWSSIAGRRARGTATFPTPIANGEILFSVAGLGWANSGFAGADGLGSSRIDLTATQDFSNTARGTSITFWNTPDNSNVAINVAKFDANSATFFGTITPAKGFIYTPNTFSSATFAIDFSRDVVKYSTSASGFTISFTQYVPGKVVEVWLQNSAGTSQTVTHGCLANNSTVNATTVAIPGTSSIFLKYFSIGSDIANTFVSITH